MDQFDISNLHILENYRKKYYVLALICIVLPNKLNQFNVYMVDKLIQINEIITYMSLHCIKNETCSMVSSWN